MSTRKEIALGKFSGTTTRERKYYREDDNMFIIIRAIVPSIIKNFNLPDTTSNKHKSGRPT